ncbi:MAG: hypothetical protein HC804_05435 [Anaerolineae bacterium]|nr:hypothetical protein [Anaerolineae bacterium]
MRYYSAMHFFKNLNPHKSLEGRLILYFFLVSLFTVLLTVLVADFLARRALEQSIYDRLETVAMVKEESLTRWKDERFSDVVLLARSPEVRTLGTLLLDPNADQNSSIYQEAYNDLDRLLKDVLIRRATWMRY